MGINNNSKTGQPRLDLGARMCEGIHRLRAGNLLLVMTFRKGVKPLLVPGKPHGVYMKSMHYLNQNNLKLVSKI